MTSLNFANFVPSQTESNTNFMGHSPFKANIFSTSQAIPRILWNKMVHYRVRNSRPFYPCPQPVHSGQLPYRTISLNFRRLMSTIVDVPHR